MKVSGQLYRRGWEPGTHKIGCWVDSKAGLHAPEKIKIYFPCRESNPESPIVQPAT
jgi:hypothetical protein